MERSRNSLKKFRMEATGPPRGQEVRPKGGGTRNTWQFPDGLLSQCVTFPHGTEEEDTRN